MKIHDHNSSKTGITEDFLAWEELKVEAAKENLGTVLAFVNAKLEDHGCSMRLMTTIDIAVEEIFVNIASYAYSPEKGNAVIRTEILEDPLRVILTFMDKGVPYDPLAKEDPDVTLSAEERAIGGLGIFMVKNTMDSIKYEYKEGRNILTIVKKL